MKKKYIIGIHAAKYAGKTTAATILSDRYPDFLTASFAMKIKEVALAMNFPKEAVYGEEKETWMHPILGVTFRVFAQQFGTEFIRNTFNDKAWIRYIEHLFDDITTVNQLINGFIIDDIRFENEAQTVRDYCKEKGYTAILIKIHREEFDFTKEHSSEFGLPDSLFDIVINNDGGVEGFRKQLEAYMEAVEDKHPLLRRIKVIKDKERAGWINTSPDFSARA